VSRFLVGLNPYGVAFTVGLQGLGTPRVNPRGIGLTGFIELARQIGVRSIELDWRWLMPLSNAQLKDLGDALSDLPTICSCWLSHQPRETLEEPVRCAAGIGARLVRMHLTPVVEGGRASLGSQWLHVLEHARTTLNREARRAADAGLALAIENHQDLGSEELMAIAAEAGPDVGIVFDTGNPFAVGEEPVAFAQRVAPLLRHVHLKDYRAQWTAEGYRLVRCAVGDGCVPFERIAEALGDVAPLTASIEIGALDARHIRLLTSSWWEGYPPREARELASALARLRRHLISTDEEFRTPWELDAPAEDISAYELNQLRGSVSYLRQVGWM
jgi:sugar phosphate isomerase/epimerase